MNYYKVLDSEGNSQNGGSLKWDLPTDIPGKFHEVPEVLMCSSGLHLTTEPVKWWKKGSRCFLAEGVEVQSEPNSDKVVCKKARLIRELTVKELAELNVFLEGVHTVKGGFAAVDRQATVHAYDSSTVRAYGSSTVHAYDSSTVRAYGSSTVHAYDSSTVRAYGSSTVHANGSSTVHAYDSSTVRAYGSSTVHANGSSTVHANGSSTVHANGSSTVRAYDSSTVRAYDSSTVRAYDSSTVRANGSSTVYAYGSSVVTKLHSTVKVTVNDRAVSIDRSGLETLVSGKVRLEQ